MSINIIDTVKGFHTGLFPSGYNYISGVSIKKETAKAVLIECNSGSGETVWCPKSALVAIKDISYGVNRLAVKSWIARENDAFFNRAWGYA